MRVFAIIQRIPTAGIISRTLAYGLRSLRLTHGLYLKKECNFSGTDINKVLTKSSSNYTFPAVRSRTSSTTDCGRGYQERQGLARQLLEAINCEPNDWDSSMKTHRCAYPCEQHCIVIEAQRKTFETPRPKSNTEGSSIQREKGGRYRDDRNARAGFHRETRLVDIHCICEKQACRRCVLETKAVQVDVDSASIK